MSVRLTTAQMMAAARERKRAQAGANGHKAQPIKAEQTIASHAAVGSKLDEDEFQRYLSRRFTPDQQSSAPAPLLPLSSYELTAASHLPSSAYIVPNFVSVAEERELWSLVDDSPQCCWQQLRGRRSQMWGGIPNGREDFEPSPLPQWQQQIIERIVQQHLWRPNTEEVNGSASSSCSSIALPPNHVLLNRYDAGEGIMAHKDGPLYDPFVAILSLGSHTVMHFYKELSESRLEDGAHRPALSIYIPSRSLFIFTKELYTDYYHGIQPIMEDRLHGMENDDGNLIDYKIIHAGAVAPAPTASLHVKATSALDVPPSNASPSRLLLSHAPPQLHGQTIPRSTRVSLTIRRVAACKS